MNELHVNVEYCDVAWMRLRDEHLYTNGMSPVHPQSDARHKILRQALRESLTTIKSNSFFLRIHWDLLFEPAVIFTRKSLHKKDKRTIK